MNPAQQLVPDWQFLLLAIPAFLFFWSGVVASISIVGGWHNLAKRFRQEETTFRISGEARGTLEKFRWSSLKMGPKFFPTNYGNCITVTLSDDGIGLKVMLLFRPLHPPLLIPWSAIESIETGQELLLFERTSIQIQGLANPIRIYGRAGQAIERYWTAARSEDVRRDLHT
jgi:hypothetical protein